MEEQNPQKNKKNKSFFQKVIDLWRKIPASIRPYIPTFLLIIISLVMFLFFGVLIIVSLLSGVGKALEIAEDVLAAAGNLAGGIVAIGAGIVNFVTSGLDKIGNFFHYGMFDVTENVSHELEEKFYITLEEVKDEYREKYEVEIDTVLITATLFYERDIMSMIDESEYTETEEEAEDGYYAESFIDKKKFFGQALDYIETLANYQIVEHTVESKCSNEAYNYTSEPDDDFGIAVADAKNKVTVKSYRPFNNIDEHNPANGVFIECNYDDVEGVYVAERARLIDERVDAEKRVETMCDVSKYPEPPLGKPTIEVQGNKLLNYDDNINNKKPVMINYLDAVIACEKEKSSLKQINDQYNSVNSYFDDDGKFQCNDPYKSGEGYNGCALLESSSSRHQVNNRRGGVYYYKIGNYITKTKKTTLENLFPEFFEGLSGEPLTEKLEEATEGVYDLYHAVVEQMSVSGLTIGEFFSLRVKSLDNTPGNQSDPSYKYYWTAENKFYTGGVSGGWHPAQCTTYAFGRVKEVEAEIGLTCGKEFNIFGDASGWYRNALAANGANFNPNNLLVTDIEYPSTGSLIIWGGGEGGHGHVAFIEKVYNNEAGVLVVDYTEGNVGERSASEYHSQKFAQHIGVTPKSYKNRGVLYFIGYVNPFCY